MISPPIQVPSRRARQPVSSRILSAVLAAALALGAQSLSAQANLRSPTRIAGWSADIDTIVAVARRIHAGPARPAHGAAFVHFADGLKRRLPTLADSRVIVEVQRLMAMLRDGHSLLYVMPSRATQARMLPIEVYLFDDGLYLVGGDGPARALIGQRIERIGRVSVTVLLRRMQPYVSRDNDMGAKAFASLYLVTTDFLDAWGAMRDSVGTTLTTSDRTGARHTIRLAASGVRRIRRRLFPSPDTTRAVPMYLRNADVPYWFTRLTDPGTAYLQFNQVTDAASEPLASFATRFRDSLRGGGTDRLIIDVRHNNGGNNSLLAPLLDVIEDFGRVSKNRVYVVTGRATFSAAQNFITRVERRVPRAIFVGEPSMSSPNFTGEDNEVTLQYSGAKVSISNRYWQDSEPTDRRQWIYPSIYTPQRSDDWLENRDAVLAAVFADLRRPR